MMAGALGAAAVALAGCGTVIAPAAHSSRVSGSGQPSATPGQPTPAARPLCASLAAISRVAIAQSPYPRPILPGQAGGPGQPGRAVMPAGPVTISVTAAPPATPPAPPATPATPGTPATSGKPPGVIEPWPPIVRVVTSAPRSRALARAVCDLPALPRRPVNCPALFAGVYQLTFTADGRQLPAVTIQEAGCRVVTGAGAVRTAAGRPAFWALLTKAAGPAVHWPVHLPGAPAAPGAPGLGAPTCQPPSTQPPGAQPRSAQPPGAQPPGTGPGRACLGPDRPVTTKLP
jgi:hypothetical protein